jgi:hypothetical protein
VQAVNSLAQRIAQLKSLHKRWTAVLERLAATYPEVTFHLAQSLQDLEDIIRTLERQDAEGGPPPEDTSAA